MPPRIHPPSKAISTTLHLPRPLPHPLHHHHYATAASPAPAAAYTPAPSHSQINRTSPPLSHHPVTQPPSHKPPSFRKSQLLRSYASLLRSTPLMLLFQHNNLRSSEWAGLRRELARALRRTDEASATASLSAADTVKLQIIQTGIFATALRIVEFYKPHEQHPGTSTPASSGAGVPLYSAYGAELTHTLSRAAHEAMAALKPTHELDPLLSGPLVLLTFPTVSPQHLATAFSILSPSSPDFPAPKKKVNPGWHDPAVQGGVQKLLLLGARVEGRVFDVEGARWVGGIEGGLEGLRGQVVGMLQSVGGGLTRTLESAGRSLHFTVEGRRMMLEDAEKPVEEARAE